MQIYPRCRLQRSFAENVTNEDLRWRVHYNTTDVADAGAAALVAVQQGWPAAAKRPTMRPSIRRSLVTWAVPICQQRLRTNCRIAICWAGAARAGAGT